MKEGAVRVRSEGRVVAMAQPECEVGTENGSELAGKFPRIQQ